MGLRSQILNHIVFPIAFNKSCVDGALVSSYQILMKMEPCVACSPLKEVLKLVVCGDPKMPQINLKM